MSKSIPTRVPHFVLGIWTDGLLHRRVRPTTVDERWELELSLRSRSLAKLRCGVPQKAADQDSAQDPKARPRLLHTSQLANQITKTHST